ncbi:hypothetical protein SAMN02745146_1819 [Hymenobacter daecheongensis DSM 21074]|uniref:TTHB210-like domain-containing protein n=1 Tax=Hymenobacter daecheongensis DSM 21074 TaxID=1121955 RepID=A0A1M6EUN0_9BACT|nr:DUF5602 domain-containing protein [Hymenobacter daecheongensis]SHI89113.1 hypothetical protein SAMN02745146_1819 [Hymenobacter daecheongensis DSM 21074]
MKNARNSVAVALRYLLALLALGGPLLLASCDDDDNNDSPKQPSLEYGPAVQIGTGSARSFVAADADGKPTEIGVAVNQAALNSLPATPAFGTMYDVPLPAANAAAAQMPFDHLSFDWNPNGHEPASIYTLPHFDAHFYMIPMSVQHAITLDDPKGDIFPASAKLPAGYITPPNVVPGRTIPMMGRHWSDPTSPEFTPGTAFTHTLIYGSYDGKVAFVEPMFTKALLVPGVNIEKAIKQPATYEVTGKYFPTAYTIRQDAATGEYIISLKGMVMR